jgi:hypothetical protein
MTPVYHNWLAIASSGFYPFAADATGITDSGQLRLPSFIGDLKINVSQEDKIFLNFIHVTAELISLGLATEIDGEVKQLSVITQAIETWKQHNSVPVKTVTGELIGWIMPGVFEHPHELLNYTYSTYPQSKISEHCLYRNSNKYIYAVKTTNSREITGDVGFHASGDSHLTVEDNTITVNLNEDMINRYAGMGLDNEYVTNIGGAYPIDGKIIIRVPAEFTLTEIPNGVALSLDMPFTSLCSARDIDVPDLFTETDPAMNPPAEEP